jgi:nucleotide-binding universal stress UspA family protein
MKTNTRALEGFESIFHPSDFSEASEIAFAHALKIALAATGKLTLFHSANGGPVDWHEFPGVRRTLEQWKLLPAGSPRNAVAELGIRVSKIVGRGHGPVDTVRDFLRDHGADLIVLATHAHEGRMQWLRGSVAEPIARDSHQMTLFVPHGVEGFISRADGSVRLRNVLIPAALEPWPQSAVSAATRLAAALAAPQVEFHLLHVGEEGDLPALELPAAPGWEWNKLCRRGPVVDTILHAADAYHADLVVMTTDGHHGFLDALRGNTTERVLHRLRCPLLAIPARPAP